MWKDPVECCALWQSLEQVHFADNTLDYLGLIVYHDNDISNGTYSNVGDIKRQGEIFNHTGTGGNVTGDHVHLETGKGEVNLSQYRYHFLDSTSCRRLVPDDALFVNATIVTPKAQYNWKEFQGGVVPPDPPDPPDPPEPPTPTPSEHNNLWKKWFLMRNKKIILRY